MPEGPIVTFFFTIRTCKLFSDELDENLLDALPETAICPNWYRSQCQVHK